MNNARKTLQPKRILYLGIALATLIVITAACSGKSSVDPASLREPIVSGTDISDDLFSYQININGRTYTVPCPASDFLENGWILSSDQDLAPGESQNYGTMRKANYSIKVGIYNAGTEKAKMSKCVVFDVTAHVLDSPQVILPGGLLFDQYTKESDLISLYGHPDKKYDNPDSTSYQYGKDIDNAISFGLHEPGTSEKFNDSYVRITSSKDAVDETRPDYSDVAATDIADALDSFQFVIDGQVFTVPLKVTELTENGWELQGENGVLKPDYYAIGRIFRKGDTEIWSYIYNPTDRELLYSEGVVTRVELQFSRGFPYIILPGNFIFDKFTTAQEIMNQYGEPFEIKNNESSTVLSYKRGAYSIYKYIEFEIALDDSYLISTHNKVTFVNFNTEAEPKGEGI